MLFRRCEAVICTTRLTARFAAIRQHTENARKVSLNPRDESILTDVYWPRTIEMRHYRRLEKREDIRLWPLIRLSADSDSLNINTVPFPEILQRNIMAIRR